ncbi:alcohol dehydrogenase catalytic domain-containing protein [Streptomyces sp. NPDC051172]|uniref:alcohol dehydrogenase catalytic domain-containing protein n=1 Tax=Streptomyces sp. NPDC051172 TaxID=3155796 RepID=UPI003411F7A0
MSELPETMSAVRLHDWGKPPRLEEVPVPRPTGQQVLLQVEAAGLCHSDLHIMDAAPGMLPYRPPFTLGHEVVGTVVATGDEVANDLPGGRYAVHGIWSCGHCRQCLRGRENYCVALTGPIGGGIGYDGGLAEYLLVPTADHLVPAPGVDPVALAPLTDAGLTAYHALRPYTGLVPGGVVVVVGIGGLGHLALQLVAQLEPCAIVAVDAREEARALAGRLGATVVAASVGEAAAAVSGMDGGPGADLVLDFVGSEETLRRGVSLLAPGGQLALVGSAGGRLSVAKGADLPRGWGITAPFWGPRRDLEQVAALASQGKLHAETETYRLDQALEAYERLRAGEVHGRAVVAPGR